MEELKNTVVFPSFKDFRSSLVAKNSFGKELADYIALKYDEYSGSFEDFLAMAESYYGLSLRNYVKISEGKLLFCDDFSEKVKVQTNPSVYEESKEFFKKNCRTMLDYIEHYNLIDCR